MRKVFMSLFLCFVLTLSACSPDELPAPEVEEGYLGSFGVDKNINTKTIDSFLGREDTVYRDLRMLIDPADYSAIGGDSYLSGFIRGFEVIPYPFIATVWGLPEEVGVGYTGESLFAFDGEDYIMNYKESQMILEEIFPKDKNIFIMCGGGGYAMQMKDMLIKLGWDENKIWHVGCYWDYTGENNVEVKIKYGENNEHTYYAFHRVDYIPLVFAGLTPLNGDLQ